MRGVRINTGRSQWVAGRRPWVGGEWGIGRGRCGGAQIETQARDGARRSFRRGTHSIILPRMTHAAALSTALALLVAGPFTAARAQPSIGAAPAGNPVAIAQRVIHANFERSVCEHVTRAERLPNGSIHSTCNTGEVFRVFEIGGQVVAMRCAAAARYGVEGC